MFRKITEEQPIASVTTTGTITDIGGMASKAIPPGYRYRYSIPIRYTLADGTELDTTLRALTKPKLDKELASTTRRIAAGQVFAEQWQTDDKPPYWTFITRMVLSLSSSTKAKE